MADLDLPADLEGQTRDVIRFALTSAIAPSLLLDGGGLVELASPAALADLRISPDIISGMPIERAIGVGVTEVEEVAAGRTSRLSSIGLMAIRWRAHSLAQARVDGGWLVEFQVESAAPNEHDLTARSLRLEELLADLTDRFEALNRYLGLISHDLQAPTRRLLSFVELLRADLAEDRDPDERIAAIEAGATYLLDLTTKLLQYSRLGARPLPLQAVDAQAALDLALEQLSEVLVEAGAVVTVPERLPTVIASSTYLTVVFQNLIQNAIKYRVATREPAISVTWSQAGTDAVRIDVTDNGIGVDDDQRSAIFQPFRRTAPALSGTVGIGLATVRDLVQRFGGTILVSRTSRNEGSTFTLTLTLAPDESGEDPP